MTAEGHKHDKSNGYETVAERFMAVRNARVGAATVREWSRTLPRGGSILELGCGHGVPISQVMINDGFDLYGVDASATLIAAFRARFRDAHAECAAVEDSEFFRRTFDGAIAWGLMFLLPAHVQKMVIRKVAGALNRGGTFLFTSPQHADTWPDALSGRSSISLGSPVYEILCAEGLALIGESSDEGGNHYYLAAKGPARLVSRLSNDQRPETRDQRPLT